MSPSSPPPTSPSAERALSLIAGLLLMIGLNLMGLAFRGLVEAPYSWCAPRRDPQTQPESHLAEEAEACGSWEVLLERAAPRSHDANVRSLLEEGSRAADGVGQSYARILAVLSPAQRAEVLAPERRQVDALYPGITAEPYPLVAYCATALAAQGALPCALQAGPSEPSWRTMALPHPTHLFWGLTRSAITADSTLTQQQRSLLLGALRDLGDRARAYHDVRARLWYACGLPRVPHGDRTPGSPFPPPRELRAVYAAGARGQ